MVDAYYKKIEKKKEEIKLCDVGLLDCSYCISVIKWIHSFHRISGGETTMKNIVSETTMMRWRKLLQNFCIARHIVFWVFFFRLRIYFSHLYYSCDYINDHALG